MIFFREKAQKEEQERLTGGRQKSGRAITASLRIMPFVGRSAKTAVRQQQQQQQQHIDNNQKNDAQKILNSSKVEVENHES